MALNISPRVINRYVVVIFSLTLLALTVWLADGRQFLQHSLDFPIEIVAVLLAFQIANLFVVSFRFWRVLKHFGVSLPWKVASRACVSGHVAGLFLISLFGQVLGRNAVLRKYGVEPVVMSGLAVYERAVLAIISGLFCFLGVFWLFGQRLIVSLFNAYTGIEVIAFVFACLVSFWFGGSQFEKKFVKQIFTWANGWRLAEIIAITLLGSVLTLSCFVISIAQIDGVHVNLIDLFAAAAIISFAATLPITVNGWGVREVTAVFVLEKLGYSATDAVLVSVFVGVCSTLVVLGAIPLSIKSMAAFKPAKLSVSYDRRAGSGSDIAKSAAWCFGMASAVAVFFQAHIELSGGEVNLNLADPFAILALAAVIQYIISAKRLPDWQYVRFNYGLASITLVLVFGFIRGWLEVGVTQWALGSRLIGWMVLLGYLSAGYLVVAYAGSHGLRRFSETIIITAAVIVVIQLGLRLLSNGGNENFAGYAGNRNAFAFQLLVALAAHLGYSKVFAVSSLRMFYFSGLFALVLSGLIWSGSRAGLGTSGILILAALLMRLADLRTVSMGIAASVLICFAVSGIHGPDVNGVQNSPVQSSFSNDNSDNERLEIFEHAWDLWRESPIVGAGLGVFYEKSTEWSDQPVVIHNTFIWILSEFGVFGATLIVAAFWGLFRFAVQARKYKTHGILLMLLIVFALFSQAHEVFYQRVFWLVLGGLLAKPVSRRYADEPKT